MSGRSIIKKYKFVFNLLEILCKFIPKRVFAMFWFLLDNSESKLALLVRYLYIKKYAKNTGENIFVGKNVTLKNISNLSLESNVSIHAYCYIDAAGGVYIGENVSIANHSSIISFEHTWADKDSPIKYNKVVLGPIYISDDVWVGCGCRILSNVKINSRSIIAAGAVVNKEVLGKTIVGGIPAKVIKEI